MPHLPFTLSYSAKRWKEHMKFNYEKDHKISPCVLQVPESLRDTKPAAYVPQIVGLGPYHHFRPEVQQMERRKRAAVKSYLKEKSISVLVKECPEKFEPIIRSCYDGFIDLDKGTLAWVVIVDGLFLLDFMSKYSSQTENLRICPKNEALVPDIMMLENQIPIILIGEMRGFLNLSENVASDAVLEQHIHEFCKEQSPLQFATDGRTIKHAFNKKKHMLHFMYTLIVKNQSQEDDDEDSQADDEDSQNQIYDEEEDSQRQTEDNSQRQNDDEDSQRQTDDEDSRSQIDGRSQVPNSTSRVGELAKEFGLQAGEIFKHAIEEFNTALAESKLAELKVSGNVEKVSNVLRNFQKILHLDHMKGSLGNQTDIPSASRLNAILKLKFKQLPDNCGIGDIKLKGKTLHLPVITLNSNSEVILRNLVAYESTSKMRSTKLRDYMDLICGIIKSEKDVALLRKREIIKGQLNNAEIVRMCNGMKKCDEKPDDNSKVHKIVTDVKDEFNKLTIVKACRGTMKFFAESLVILKLFFSIWVMVFLALPSFRERNDCQRSSYGGANLQTSYLGELDPKAKLMLPRKLYRY